MVGLCESLKYELSFSRLKKTKDFLSQKRSLSTFLASFYFLRAVLLTADLVFVFSCLPPLSKTVFHSAKLLINLCSKSQ